VAFDFNGHGYNKRQSKDVDLSTENLIQETIDVIGYVIEKYPRKSIVLMGHSMGGAIASKTAKFLFDKCPKLASKIGGIILIDSLETIAIESIPQMKEMLKKRQSKFKSI
jgi:protein phosphatase methylesterase 1